MRFLFVFLSFVASCAFAADISTPALAEPATKEMPRVVMARVGAHEITVETFMQFLVKNPSRVKEATTVEGKANLLREAIEYVLLLQAMREESLLPDHPAPADQQKAFTQLESKYFPLPPSPDEATLRDYYQSHKTEFGIPASVRLSQIQFRVKKSSSEEEKAAARKRAEAALARLQSGESFGEVAEELTENPRAKASKGDVGFVKRDGDPWLDQALRGIKKGGHTGVLDSPVGYDILMLTDEREAIVTPFEDARDSVAKKMQAEARKKVRAAYVKKLADRIGVEIVSDELKGAYPNGVFP